MKEFLPHQAWLPIVKSDFNVQLYELLVSVRPMSFFVADMTHRQLGLVTNKWQVYGTELRKISFRASASPECRIHCF